MRNWKRLLSGGYIATLFLLFLYSFTQVDLGLTLTRASVWQAPQHFFQHIGYFDRPLSTMLYIVLLFLLFGFYLLFLFLAAKKGIDKKNVLKLVLVTAVLGAFSYNAFSYDLFNYIFDAKIITHYQQNPYEHKALDYAGDPMLGFMHWTHRVYPYGPVWLFLTVPLSFIGFQFLLPTILLFKFLAAASYLGTVYFISKILRKISPDHELLGIIAFGLNPLVIIESLVSAHNDITMMFFAVLGVYLLVSKKYFLAFLGFAVAYGVKFATVALPIHVHVAVLAILAGAVFYLSRHRNIHMSWARVFLALCAVMFFPVLFASLRTNFQPWYLLYLLPFAALVSDRYFVLIPMIILSFFALLQYVPFFYVGNWDPPIPAILNVLIILSVVLSGVAILLWNTLYARRHRTS